MGKFNVGDTVMVRKDLVTGSCYDGDCFFPSEMRSFMGHAYKIEKETTHERFAFFGIDPWRFSPSMLEPVSCGLSDPFKHGQKLVVTNTSGNLYCIGDIVEYGSFDGVYNCKRLSDGTPQRLRPEQLKPYEEERVQGHRHLCAAMFSIPVKRPTCDSLPRPGIRKEIRDRLLHL